MCVGAYVIECVCTSNSGIQPSLQSDMPCDCLSVCPSDVTSSVPNRLSFGAILIAVLVYKQAKSVMHKQLNQAKLVTIAKQWLVD